MTRQRLGALALFSFLMVAALPAPVFAAGASDSSPFAPLPEQSGQDSCRWKLTDLLTPR